MSSSDSDSFTFSLLVLIPFFFFFSFLFLVSLLWLKLSTQGYIDGPRVGTFVLSEFTGKSFIFSLLSMKLAVGFSKVTFILLRYFRSTFTLMRAFCLLVLFCFVLCFLLYWIFSYIEMKQPWVYMCSPSRSPLPPPSPPDPSRSSQCTRSEGLSHASNLGWWSVSP